MGQSFQSCRYLLLITHHILHAVLFRAALCCDALACCALHAVVLHYAGPRHAVLSLCAA